MNRDNQGRFARNSFVRQSVIALVLIIITTIACGVYFYKHPYKIILPPVEIQVPVEKGIPPVLARIAKCESDNNHLDPKTGQVLMRANTDKTVDVGRYQINSVWFKKATELGFDLTKDKDNEAMAVWIYENRGTGDWVYSQKCWSK